MRKQQKSAEHTEQQIDALRERVLDLRERVRQMEADASAASGAAARAVMANAPDANALALQRDETVAALQRARADLAQAEAALRDALRPELDSLRREAEAYDRLVTEQVREAEAELATMASRAEVLLQQLAKTPEAYSRTVAGFEERGQRLLAQSLGVLGAEPLRLEWRRHGLAMLAMTFERLAQLALSV